MVQGASKARNVENEGAGKSWWADGKSSVIEGVGKSWWCKSSWAEIEGADKSSWADGKRWETEGAGKSWRADGKTDGGWSWADGKSSTSLFNHFGSHSCGTYENLEGKIVEVIDVGDSSGRWTNAGSMSEVTGDGAGDSERSSTLGGLVANPTPVCTGQHSLEQQSMEML